MADLPGPSGAAIQAGSRPELYYHSTREDIARLIPAGARRVLEVGCGYGHLGRILRERGHRVAGVELVPEVAAGAAANLDEVFCGDVERAALPWPAASFDAIVLADVLEHLVDPWKTLRSLTPLLAPGGIVVASIPNVQNYRLIRDLVRGRFEYADSGLLDRGHLRFFTWSGIRGLFEGAGLRITRREGLWHRTTVRRLLLWLTLGGCEPYLVRQYLVVAERAAQP